MFVHTFDPVLLEVFGLQIRYYGLVYALGFLLILLSARAQLRYNPIKNLTTDALYDLLFWTLLGALAGARFFHVFIYEPGFYLSQPAEILALWHGGMSIHGGVLGAAVASLLFLRRRRIPFYPTADMLILPFPVVLAFGRIANFLNAELVGPPTNLPWCVRFPDHEGCRHPTVLYESIKNVVIFGLLSILYVSRQRFAAGTLFWSFVGAYSLLRFFVQFLRPEDALLLGLDAAQLMSIVLLPLAVYMLYRLNTHGQVS